MVVEPVGLGRRSRRSQVTLGLDTDHARSLVHQEGYTTSTTRTPLASASLARHQLPHHEQQLTNHLITNSTPHQPAKLGVMLASREHARRVNPINDRVRVGRGGSGGSGGGSRSIGSHYEKRLAEGG